MIIYVCHVSLILAFPVIQGAHRVSAPHWNVSPWSPRSVTWDTRTSPVRKMEDGLWLQDGAPQWCERWFIKPMNTIVISSINHSDMGVIGTNLAIPNWGTTLYGPPCHGSKDWKIQDILVGGWATYPSEKWWSESQLGWLFPIYGNIKAMLQTTNQHISISQLS